MIYFDSKVFLKKQELMLDDFVCNENNFKENCELYKVLNKEQRIVFKKNIAKYPDLTKMLENNDIKIAKSDSDLLEILLTLNIKLDNCELIDLILLNNKKVNSLLKRHNYLNSIKNDIIEIASLTDNENLLSLI